MTEESTRETTEQTEQSTEQTTEEQAAEPTWHYGEGIPGQGEAPEWFKSDKYQTIADQAKGYKELESRFGSFTGAPDEYEIKLSEEITGKGIELNNDDPLMEEAIKFAKESNMSQDGFEKMVELYAMGKIADQEAAESFRNQELDSLGQNAQERIGNIDAWAKANLPVEHYEGLVEMATTASAVKTLELMIAKTQKAPVSTAEAAAAPGGPSEDEIKAMQFEKDEFGNRRIHTDRAFRKKFEEASKRFYGTHDHNIVIGA